MTPEAERILDLLRLAGSRGCTAPESSRRPGGPLPVTALRELAAAGLAVRLVESRDLWRVWVTTENVQGREIGFSGVEDNTEGTDMDDKSGTEENEQPTEGQPEQQEADPFGPVKIINLAFDRDGEPAGLTTEQDRRSTALFHAKGILGDHKVAKGPLTSPSVTPPAVGDLISIAEYIVGGHRDA